MKKMSKDGQTFFDIDDSDESVNAAKAKGYKEYVPMTKNGTDVFNVEFSEDSYTAAVGKGYKDLERYKFEQPKEQEIGFGEAALKGLGNATGLADEATGFVAGLGAQSQGGSYIDAYRSARDYAREGDKAALEQQPVAFIGSKVLGGVAGGAIAPALNTLKGSVALGAGMGLAESEADLTKPSLENFGQAAIDTAGGAAAGALGYGVGKGLEKGASAAMGLAQNANKILTAIGRGAARGSKEVSEDLPRFIGINEIGTTVGALKGAVDEVKALGKDLAEFKAVAEAARKVRPLSELGRAEVQVIGNGKAIGEFTDDEAILAALVAEGDNPVKQWFATKASTLQPGQIDADQYGKILSMGSAERNAAREFDPRVAAQGLKPVIEDTEKLFLQARSDRFKQLQDKARGAFNPNDATPAFKALDEAIESIKGVDSIPGSVRGVLSDVKKMIGNGSLIKQWKLNPGKWENVGATEQFNRLQKARELIDDQIKWANAKGGQSTAQSVLMDVRTNIDNVLKISPDKVDADKIFSDSMRVEKNFFDATDFRGAGVDESKIMGLLGDKDRAHRFRTSMEEFKAFVNNPELSPQFREQGQKLIDQIETATNTMQTKGELGAFRQKQGPTSPAIERLQSIQGKNSLSQDAVRNPAGFVNSADQFSKYITKRLGKPLEKMEPADRQKSLLFWSWTRKNQDASPQQYEAKFKELFPNADNQAAVDQFLKK